jgi:hypothetical protein
MIVRQRRSGWFGEKWRERGRGAEPGSSGEGIALTAVGWNDHAEQSLAAVALRPDEGQSCFQRP